MEETGVTINAQDGVHTSCNSVPATKIQINISGTLFQCQQSQFSTFPWSRLANLAAQKDNFDTENKEYYFDKDPVIFNSILDAYRTGVIHAPNEVCGERFKQELIFWGLPISNVAPCCWKVLHAVSSNLSMMNQVTDAILQSVDVGFSSDGHLTSRQKLWLLLEKPDSSRMAWVWAACVSLVVIVSSIFLCTLSLITIGKTEIYISWLEVVSYLFITAEILACLVSCQNWRELLRNWMHWVEVLSCSAFWICTFFELLIDFSGLGFSLVVLRCLTIARLVRVLRVCSNIEEFHIICITLRASISNINIFVIMYGFVTVIFAFMFYFESMFGEWRVIENVFQAMYMAIITATTVGYGDIVAETAVGKMVSGLCALSGIFTMAIFIGCIAKKYGDVYACYKSVKAHIRMLQRLAPEGQMIRLRANDQIVLMTLNRCTYSFKTVPVPRPGPGKYTAVQQTAPTESQL